MKPALFGAWIALGSPVTDAGHRASLRSMILDGLPLPARLVSLAEAGVWPRTGGIQNFPTVSEERVRLISPQESKICLWAYESLCTLTKQIESYTDFHKKENARPELDFWRMHGDLDNINSALAIEIADFGIGTDTSIVLDYRNDRRAPAVLRLDWAWEDATEPLPDGRIERIPHTRWVICAATFDEFVELLGLDTMAPVHPLE